jgi:membrane protein implicated in regulation of membrane protease activity
MSDHMETVLRNSLDAVDRGRRWAMLGVGALFLAAAFLLAGMFGAAQIGVVTPKILYVATTAQMLFISFCTALVTFHVTRMAKTVLRAIELGSKSNRA